MTINLQSVLHIIQCNTIERNTEINRHFIKEKLDSGLIYTPYISTNRQLANILTKDLNGTKFQASISKLEMKNIYSPQLEGEWKIEIRKDVILNRELGRQSHNQRDFIVIELGKSWTWVLGFLCIYICVCVHVSIQFLRRIFQPFILPSLFYRRHIEYISHWNKRTVVL